MSHKLRSSLFAAAAALMMLLLLPYGTLAASNHAHSISRTLGSQGMHRSARATIICVGTVTPPILCQYGYFYNTVDETVPVEGDVAFSNAGPASSNITQPTSSTIQVNNTTGLDSIYRVKYSVIARETDQFALMLDGTVVPGTTYEAGENVVPNSGTALITIPAGIHTITLRNHSSFGPVDLHSGMDGTQPNVNASLLIEQIS